MPYLKKISVLLIILLPVMIINYTGEKNVTDAVCQASQSNGGANWPPAGNAVRCSINRDTWISSINNEKDGSNGGAERLKLKGQQEYTIIDIDPSPLMGKIVTGALLHFRSATPVKAPVSRLGVSTLASKWIEGASENYKTEKGSSCFNYSEYNTDYWAYSGSSFMDVVFGRGNTIWKFADCTSPDSNGWQACAVDPDVIAARLSGISYGFGLYDEVGSTWSQNKGEFRFNFFPNRFIYSRESGKSAPWMEIWVSGKDIIPPEEITFIEVDINDFPAGQALVRWQTPEDHGGGKTMGFHISYIADGDERHVPRYLIPVAGKPNEIVQMHIQDIPFKPGEIIDLIIKPVDSAGNVGKAFRKKIQLSQGQQMPEIEASDILPFSPNRVLPVAGGLKISVVDLLDKIDPVRGEMIPSQYDGYKGGNHLYSAKEKLIRLQAAKNETIHFQLNLEGKSDYVSISYNFNNNPEFRPEIFQFAYVETGKGKKTGFLPDPLVPLDGSFSIPSNTGNTRISNQTNHSLICEVYVPHEVMPGKKQGELVIVSGHEKIKISVDLTVWNFTLPDKLSFVPEMNAYGTRPLYNDLNYYRLAHEHRTCLNWLPYGWDGKPSFAPEWSGGDFIWELWDKKVAPLLDGSAFADMPRKGEPVDVFYLPLSENWPVNIFDHYKPSYWADEAFSDEYKKKLGRAFNKFALHCNAKGWNSTAFQFYLNNKIYHRKNFPRSSAPWIFDEPVNTQDFWALRWYGLIWRDAVVPVMGETMMWYRADVSYTQYGRDILRGITDIEYIGNNNYQKTRMKDDERVLWGISGFSEYGTSNMIDASNIQSVMWCISAWSRGAKGVLPWQTLGSMDSWKIVEQTALFYPSNQGPVPSVRLKAFSRGQQDVEYLALLSSAFKLPRYVVAGWLAKTIDLTEVVEKQHEGDAGTAMFNKVTPVELWELRYRTGKMLSGKNLPYKKSISERNNKISKDTALPEIGYVTVAPTVESHKPSCDNFKHN